jgi:hypothetical protein
VKHPDDTQEAIDIMTRHAQALIGTGVAQEVALERTVNWWRGSLERAQMLVRYNADLRASGKPTLHVSLFEVAKFR